MDIFMRAGARIALVTALLSSALTGVAVAGSILNVLAFACALEAGCWLLGSGLGYAFNTLNIRETPIAKTLAVVSLPLVLMLVLPALAASCPVLLVPTFVANLSFALAFLAISALTMYRGA